MPWRIASFTFLALALVLQTSRAISASQRSSTEAEARAVGFLSREVPRWHQENKCYSCHNNGDAARALIVAAKRGHDVGDGFNDTLQWLAQPQRWNESPPTRGIDDKPLARIQFAGALQLAVDAGRIPREPLERAVAIVTADQKSDGSWQLDTSQSLGSPTTYGTTLATAMARRVVNSVPGNESSRVAALNSVNSVPGNESSAALADAWLRAAPVETVLDAAAVAFGLADARDAKAEAQRARALDTIRRGQGPSGGWGPYVTSAPEVFDTALVVLVLAELTGPGRPSSTPFSARDLETAISRGRTFLLERQVTDGSWPETTRPRGQESYAQRISTTGWALLALLESSPLSQ